MRGSRSLPHQRGVSGLLVGKEDSGLLESSNSGGGEGGGVLAAAALLPAARVVFAGVGLPVRRQRGVAFGPGFLLDREDTGGLLPESGLGSGGGSILLAVLVVASLPSSTRVWLGCPGLYR